MDLALTQWQAEYPMLTNNSLLVLRASSRVSELHSCHAVGLFRWERTYGLLLSPHRLVREIILSCTGRLLIVVQVVENRFKRNCHPWTWLEL